VPLVAASAGTGRQAASDTSPPPDPDAPELTTRT
jgi:hypothetical protein